MRSTRYLQKVYELRVYTMVPSGFPKYVQLTNELLHLRTAHSKLSGFWVTEIGGQNEVVHIWEYDSLAHRKQVRDALGSDDEWKSKYLAHIRDTWASQQNFLLNVQSEIESHQAPFYRLRMLANNASAAQASMGPDTQRVAAFQISSGKNVGSAVLLESSTNLDSLIESPESGTSVKHSRILFNAPWASKLGSRWK